MLINCKTKTNKLWSPGSKSRVCSDHFVESCSYPSKNLGYDSREKISKLFPSPRRKRRRLDFSEEVPSEVLPSGPSEQDVTDIIANEDRECGMSELMDESHCEVSSQINELQKKVEALTLEKKALSNTLNKCQESAASLASENKSKSLRIKILRKKILDNQENCQCKQPLHTVLLKTDSDVNFYTGLPNKACFDAVHQLASPHLKKRWFGKKKSKLRKPSLKSFNMGRKPALSSRDEMFLTLIKLRLGLTEKDLAARFKIGQSTVSAIFKSWVRLLAKVLGCLIFVPDQESLNVTRPKRFDNAKHVSQIIDCFEVFIETPKSLELQKLTWSEYKHHNTVKFLIGCLHNSSVSFLSCSYPGVISDKKIVEESNFLDTCPRYSYIMADKGFSIQDNCAARNVGLYIPPGKRGAHQMLPAEIKKTKRIANLRILIEQVIRQVRSFKILTQEVPLTLLPCIDDAATVCAALVNFKKPIFKD